MGSAEDKAHVDAIAWHVRLGSANEEEWEAFTAWLESDPSHREVYDAVEDADADLEAALGSRPVIAGRPTPAATQDSRPARRWRLAGALAAVAAILLILVFAYPAAPPGRLLVPTQTAAGETRSVALADGSRIHLNGETRVLLDKADPRVARIEKGEAVFEVAHDAAHPFTIWVGDTRIQDAGTVFNVSLAPSGFEIAVAEGAVVVNPEAENVTLKQGRSLFVPADNGPAIAADVDPRSVASWRRGELIYSAEPLANVAADISRSLGTQVTLAPEIAARTFTGIIVVDRAQPVFFQRLEGLLDVRALRTVTGWQLSATDRANVSSDTGDSGT